MVKAVLSALVFCFVANLSFGAKVNKELAQCQKWKDKIEKYNALRKRGGKAKEMDKWYRVREDLQDKFSENDCKRWHRKLK
ncbi:hypothetical protein [Parendozoicomonas sp. Alg238-R29]|uniref:hypothetical protein n=1 Tax=Parendozoicomonas sp. Alg238-R29 TaxID=2993446 RepID=UPI00248DD40A|nr:hypothetical protein [Parendozoicomonas sp. Alg238-R29]